MFVILTFPLFKIAVKSQLQHVVFILILVIDVEVLYKLFLDNVIVSITCLQRYEDIPLDNIYK